MENALKIVISLQDTTQLYEAQINALKIASPKRAYEKWSKARELWEVNMREINAQGINNGIVQYCVFFDTKQFENYDHSQIKNL